MKYRLHVDFCSDRARYMVLPAIFYRGGCNVLVPAPHQGFQHCQPFGREGEMNYYQFHIADWALHTSHLTLEEEGVYRRLLDYYYDTESPIPTETQPVIRRLRLRGHEETVAEILGEFFVLDADGWHNRRADREIEAYQQKAEQARANGKKGGRPKKNKDLQNEKPKETQPVISGIPEKSESKANQEPRTINQEPSTPLERGSKILTGVSASEKIEKPDATASPPPAHSAPENSKNVIGKRIQQPFRPTEAAVRLAEKHGLDVGIEADLFVAHYESTGEFRDSWDACFRKWLLRSMQYKADAEQRAQSPPGRASNGFKKFDAADYNRGNDGYGKPRKNNIIDVNGIVVDEVPALQGKISD